MSEIEDDPDVSVEVDVILSGTLNVRMKLSQARSLAKKLDASSQVDVDDVPGVDWGEAVNALDGVVDDIDFLDDAPTENT